MSCRVFANPTLMNSTNKGQEATAKEPEKEKAGSK